MKLQEVQNVFLPDSVFPSSEGDWLRFHNKTELSDYDFFKSMPPVLCNEEDGNKFERKSFNSDDHYVVYKPLKRTMFRVPGDW